MSQTIHNEKHMSSHFFLGIDIGTYSSKGVITDDKGKVVASASVPHELSIPHPGYAEHDAEQTWWHDFVVLCQQLLKESGIDPKNIKAIGHSAISPALVCIGAEGEPLMPAILYQYFRHF